MIVNFILYTYIKQLQYEFPHAYVYMYVLYI